MKLAISLTVAAVLVGAAVLYSSANGANRNAADYVGTKTCSMCHKSPDKGNQFGAWQSSAHAKAFEVLGTEEAKKIAAKLGIDDPQKSGKCLKCHSTAYNFTETVATDKVDVKDGVACESCHGPGAKYKSPAIMKDKAKAIENGLISPATKSCELCHNDQSPTWKGFDLNKYLEKIAHPNPKK